MAVARRILDRAAEPSYLTGGGLWGWLTTVDHKRIAVLYGLTALVFFLVGGVEALLIRVQLARPDNTFLTAGTYNIKVRPTGLPARLSVSFPRVGCPCADPGRGWCRLRGLDERRDVHRCRA